MDPHHEEHGQQSDNSARQRRAATQRAREEVVDVLAEALWTLICSGRGPCSLAGIVPGAAPRRPVAGTTGTAQPSATTGV